MCAQQSRGVRTAQLVVPLFFLVLFLVGCDERPPMMVFNEGDTVNGTNLSFWEEAEGYTRLKSDYDQDVWLRGSVNANGSVGGATSTYNMGYGSKASGAGALALGYLCSATGTINTAVGTLCQSHASGTFQTCIGYGSFSTANSGTLVAANGCVMNRANTVRVCYGGSNGAFADFSANNVTLHSRTAATDGIYLVGDKVWATGNVSSTGYCNVTGGNCISVDGFAGNAYGYNGSQWIAVNATPEGNLRVSII